MLDLEPGPKLKQDFQILDAHFRDPAVADLNSVAHVNVWAQRCLESLRRECELESTEAKKLSLVVLLTSKYLITNRARCYSQDSERIFVPALPRIGADNNVVFSDVGYSVCGVGASLADRIGLESDVIQFKRYTQGAFTIESVWVHENGMVTDLDGISYIPPLNQ